MNLTFKPAAFSKFWIIASKSKFLNAFLTLLKKNRCCRMFPHFEDISRRIFKSKYDKAVFKKLVDEWLHDKQFSEKIKEYEKKKSEEKTKVLLNYAKKLSLSMLEAFHGKKPEEIVIEAIIELIDEKVIPIKWRDYIFGHSDKEDELYPLVEKGILEKHSKVKYSVRAYSRKDLPFGNPDFVFLEKGMIGERIIAVDAKANKEALKNFFNQALNYANCYDVIYLATTGWCALSYEKSLSKIDFLKLNSLRNNLHSVHARLMYIDLTGKKYSFELENETCSPNKKYKDLIYSKLFFK